MSGQDRERQRLVKALDAFGWTVVCENKKGYLHVQCPCGAHPHWPHKTPSDPSYFRRQEQCLIGECSRLHDSNDRGLR